MPQKQIVKISDDDFRMVEPSSTPFASRVLAEFTEEEVEFITKAQVHKNKSNDILRDKWNKA